MTGSKQQKIAKRLLTISLICILNGCVYGHLPIQSAPKVPAALNQIKDESSAAMTNAPVLEVPIPVKPQHHIYLHKVRWPNESLLNIAKWYTGTGNNWKIIAKSNPNLNPNQILIGDTISIPEELLISREPMPLSFVHSMVVKKSIPRFSPNKRSTSFESPELFGPIEPEQTPPNTIAIELFSPMD